MPSQPKKMLIIAVLETLRKYTDTDHRLLQAPLLDLLKADYGLEVDRKTLRHNIEHLINAGYPLKYKRGWYYQHEFTRQELDLLIGSIARDPLLSSQTALELARKLDCMRPGCQPELPDTELTRKLLTVREALRKGKHLSFRAGDKTLTGLTPVRVERTGEPASDDGGKPHGEDDESAWTLTVFDPSSQQNDTYSLQIEDLTLSD